MGSSISLSRKSKSSKLLHSKDNRSTSTSSALPSSSTDSFYVSTCLTISSLKSVSSCSASSLSDTQVSTTALSPTKCFFDASTCQRQSFAFPTPIIEYIAMNPRSAEVYQKLIQTCKYFFARNPILIISTLLHVKCENKWHDKSPSLQCTCPWPDHHDGWEIQEKKELLGPCDLLLKDVPKDIKIWPTECMMLCDTDPQIPSDALSLIIPRLYRCDITKLYIFGSDFSLDELKFFGTNVEELQCFWPLIKDENGFDLSLKDIIAVLPKLKEVVCQIQRAAHISPEVLQVAMNSPELQEFLEHYSSRNPDAFDMDKFCEFMIENKNIEYVLYFRPDIPQTLKDQIDACKNRLANELYENGQKRPEITVKKWEQL